MNKSKFTVSALALAVAHITLSNTALAGTEPYFNPLTQSTAVATPDHINELNSPWQVPAGIGQRNLMSLLEVSNDVSQSTQRVAVLGSNASMFDMMAFDPSGRYLFIPHETQFGAGVSRYDTELDITELMFAGDEMGGNDTPDWSKDFGAFDPSRWTPNGTVVLGEEWAGLGRLVEVMHPLADAPVNPSAAVLEEGKDWRVLESIARVAHEGIQFSLADHNKTIYFVDENNSGSIYKFVMAKAGDYAGCGQTFVLSVDDFAGDATANWSDADVRVGAATWVPITDKDGNPLPGVANPFVDVSETGLAGRDAADDVGGTPYGRPEDMEISIMPSGKEMLYFTATSEQSIYSVEITSKNKAVVRLFASRETPKNLGFPATTGEIDSPDNLAQDVFGNIYVIEDQPNSGEVGGDIWFARDTDNDGVAESMDHFMSLQVDGSESTGMIFHPTDPSKFVVAVQHPDSTAIADETGFGDAVWEFDISTVVPPVCDRDGGREVYSWKKRRYVRTCTNARDFSFPHMLEWVGKRHW